MWRPPWLRAVRASREDHPSLNDGLTPIIVETLLAASVTLRRPELVESARRGGEWLLAVQQPPPHAGWAQQYDEAEHPAGMRRFEPPALAAWETRHAIDALDALARVTGDARWCPPARAAAAWLRAAAPSPGCWARFYTLDGGTPLYLAADGAPVASAADARPGYDWRGDFGIAALLRRMALGDDRTSPAPLPGDPGACPGASDPLHEGHGARGLIAQAGMQLAGLAPPPIVACAVVPLEVVDARRASLGSRRMIACLDLEGVLVPEIWINVAERTGIESLRRTTRDEPDYDKLMRGRLAILDEHRLGLPDIQAVIGTMEPLDGARRHSSTGCAADTR